MSLMTCKRSYTDKKMHTGHFYFAKNRTFLLCVDTIVRFVLKRADVCGNSYATFYENAPA